MGSMGDDPQEELNLPLAQLAMEGTLSDTQGQRWAQCLRDRALSKYQRDMTDTLNT